MAGEDDEFKKGGKNDVSNGPTSNRSCRDLPWCVLFIVHIVGFFYLGFQAASEGDIKRIVNGQDFMGNVCGAKGEPSIYGKDLSEYPFVYYTVNITSFQKKIADSMGLQPSVGEAPSLEELQAEMSKMSDPSAMMEASGSSSGDMIAGLLEYFQPVCMKSCLPDLPTGVGPLAEPRGAYWEGYVEWGGDDWQVTAWEAAGPGGALPAFNEEDCPYPAKFCSPPAASLIPNLEIMELGGYCTPTLSAMKDVAGFAEDAGALAEGAVPDDLVAGAQDQYAAAVGDLQKVWWTFIVVGVIAICVSMVYLVLMRFVLGTLVWISLIGIFVLLGSGAGFLYLKSIQCVGDSLADTGTKAAADAADSAGGGGDTTAFVSTTASPATTAAGRLLTEEVCPDGYSVSDENQRYALMLGSMVIGVLALVYLVCVICNFSRIQLAIALNKVAARFVVNQPYTLLIPPVQVILVMIYFCIWGILTMFIVSYVTPGSDVEGEYTYKEAYGVAAKSEAGACWYTSQYQYSDWEGKIQTFEDGQIKYKCSRAQTENLTGNYRFWYSLLSMLWVNEFTIAFVQLALAGGVAHWYFSTSKMNPGHTIKGITNAIRYHPGSVALGSLIVAIVQLIRYYLEYLAQQAEKQHNACMAVILRIVGCYLWCLEKCIKFINKNAYIQIAILGKSFCGAAYDAFWLILNNAGRIMAAALIAPLIRKLGVYFITIFTTYLGYQLVTFVFQDELSTPYGACFIYMIIGNVISRLCMNVFGMAVDTSLQCFVADEKANGGAAGAHTPAELTGFLAENKDKLDKVKKEEPKPVQVAQDPEADS
jgi:hypothetical protein